jgi:triacylglycerol lipase
MFGQSTKRMAIGWTLAVLAASAGVGLSACSSDADTQVGLPTMDASQASDAVTTASDAGSVLTLDASLPPPSDASLADATAMGKGAPYPIVFLHGMAGFESLGSGPFEVRYWNGLEEALRAVGEQKPIVTVTSPYADSLARAQKLLPQIRAVLAETGAAKVNLVGHSQGGIDARLLASPQGEGLGDVIASVTTVATPHRGTRVADVALRTAQGGPVEAAATAFLSLLQKTVYDAKNDPELEKQLVQLSEANMVSFNAKYLDDPRVRYESYGGRSNLRAGLEDCGSTVFPNEPQKVDALRPSLSTIGVLLEGGFPPKVNDGLVTLASAKWGTFLQCIPADHLDQVGAVGGLGFDAKAFFQQIAKRIRSNGF